MTMRINEKNRSGEYFTVPQVAQMFDVKRLTVYRWIYSGKLHAEKQGQWRITKQDIEGALKEQHKRGKDYIRK